MALGTLFVCTHCQNSILSWSDGNPYYIDEQGKKQYAYHPDHERLARCIGNDSECLCLSCGKKFRSDSRRPKAACPKCKSKDFCGVTAIEGKTCPECKSGTFREDPSFEAIS